MPPRKIRLVIVALTLLCTVGCDQTSKHFARNRLSDGTGVTFPGGFGELRLTENAGSFLGLGDSLPESMRLALFTIGVGVGLLGLLGYLAFNRRLNWLSCVGLSLVWAGGMSNLIDRITREGLVSDFIFLRLGPFHTGVFNGADVAITIGFVVLVCDFWKQRRGRMSKVTL